MGIEPTLSAWKAEVLPLNYTRILERVGFEPTKAEPADLQSAPFNRSGISPEKQNRKATFFHDKYNKVKPNSSILPHNYVN